jgi:hypothetical protein
VEVPSIFKTGDKPIIIQLPTIPVKAKLKAMGTPINISISKNRIPNIPSNNRLIPINYLLLAFIELCPINC